MAAIEPLSSIYPGLQKKPYFVLKTYVNELLRIYAHKQNKTK